MRLDAQFAPFDAAALEPFKTGNWSILEHPVLHVYVTDCCDVDAYKSTVSKEIDAWQRQLLGYGISDWMILLVETVDLKKSKNILPRTTVLDKMRLDFGTKHADRCISVLNPIKYEVKATESYRCLLNRIRLLMLSGFNKNIVKYEELIRANREKRNQVGWCFIRYFLLQEQLAFVLEMLGLHLEALVQYDELDAMFSQFVMNSEKGDKQTWMATFEQPLDSFHGITMNRDRMLETRQRIVDGTASLLELRSYVFERQAILLMGADQYWEVADRLLPFIYATLNEIETLKNASIDGALACWQFVCAIEVLTLCDQAVESKDATNIFQYSAAIWNMAKDRLYELGKLCGLLPGFTPTSDQLHMVVQLSAGIGDSVLDEEAVLVERPIESHKSSHSPNRKPKPCATERLKEALGSNQAFTKLFLELSELAISTYKHVSRLRSARLVGLDLGNFYCSLNQPQKAVVFFTDLLRELKAENWHYLASQTLLELAGCYRKMGDAAAYTKTCAAIACCVDLEVLVRTFYFDEFLKALKELAASIGERGDDGVVLVVLEDHFKVLDISVVADSMIIQV